MLQRDINDLRDALGHRGGVRRATSTTTASRRRSSRRASGRRSSPRRRWSRSKGSTPRARRDRVEGRRPARPRDRAGPRPRRRLPRRDLHPHAGDVHPRGSDPGARAVGARGVAQPLVRRRRRPRARRRDAAVPPRPHRRAGRAVISTPPASRGSFTVADWFDVDKAFDFDPNSWGHDPVLDARIRVATDHATAFVDEFGGEVVARDSEHVWVSLAVRHYESFRNRLFGFRANAVVEEPPRAGRPGARPPHRSGGVG